MQLIKQRKAKKSDRGYYIQDKELTDVFTPGQAYKYVLDKVNKKIIILHSDDGKGNKVSKRKTKNGMKPVIDIRDRDALSVFNDEDAQYLQVSIYEDRVVVETYIETEEESENIVKKAVKVVKNKISKKKNVVDISQVLSVKQKSRIVLSKKDLEKAVGSYQQLSFDDFGWSVEDDRSISKDGLTHIEASLSNIHIPLQIASLFSGAGVMDAGFKESGYEIVFALELDKEACLTYRHNFGDHIVNADITQYDKSQITKAPVMVGGSPCQGFSAANRTSNFLDNPNNMLVKQYIEAIKKNENCRVFVLENVPQILTAGNGRFKEEIYEALNEFEITSGILAAADYNSAQLRKRAIFIGSKIGKIDLPEPFVKVEDYKTVREAFEGLNDSIPNQLDYSKPKADTLQRMETIPPGGNWKDIPEHLQTQKMKVGSGPQSSVYRRLEWDKPSITIINPRKSNITHPSLNRSLTIRECARLFGLKDDFVFKGKLNSMQQQIANAVPLELAKAVADKIKHAIMQFNIRNRNVGFA